jgi:hypothetical protein
LVYQFSTRGKNGEIEVGVGLKQVKGLSYGTMVVWVFGQEQIGSSTYISAAEPPQIAAKKTGGS